MQIGPTKILDTFAEAFGMRYTRLIITAVDRYWLDAALRELTGYSASVIACDVEAGVERSLDASETPDGRPGAAVLLFGFSGDALSKAVSQRVGQCVMTCPTTACFDGLLDAADRIPLGKHIRFFGDGFQKSKQVDQKRFWRIPVMDGEFLVAETVGVAKGVAGGNVILQGTSGEIALQGAKRGIEAILDLPGMIAPFPGGVVRSGSKVGSRYKGLKASTSDPYCPTLKGRVESNLLPEANAAYEIVIDGTSEESVSTAMQSILRAVAGEGIVAIGAGNYGGKLGKYHFHLHQLLS